ncbi:MAG: SBBP repeat-containing protein, partial [Bacteroidetes bacterium]|nr:SBBP repeat-containing protein [Bacteroidota bacterium]
MKKILFTSGILLFPFFCLSQNGFQRIYGNPSYGNPRMIRTTADGGYIMAGSMYNFVQTDVYVLKTDAGGNVQFSKTYGGSSSGQEEYAYDIKQTSDGGYIVTGRTNLVDPNYDVYVLKLDANGVLQWSKTFGCANTDWGDAVLQTSDGGYIICGQTFCSAALGNAYLIKTDSVGNLQWTKTYGGTASDEEFYEIEQTSDGGYIMTGWTTSFGAGGYDLFLVKTDTGGTVQWSKTFGGAGNDLGTRVRQTASGNYVVCGYTDGFGAGSTDMYLLKTDPAGNLLWSKTIGNSLSELAFDLQITSSAYILSGYSYLSPTDRDAVLINTDTSGSVQWSMQYGDSLDDNALSFKQTGDGGFIVGAYTTSFAWNPHIYLIKTDSLGISGCNESPISLAVTVPATVESGPSYSVNTMSFSGTPPSLENNLTLIDTMLCESSSCSFTAPTYQWAENIGTANADYGYDITTDNLGNVYVTGRFQSTADFDPGPGTANLTSVGTADMFFAKYDANGNYIWAKDVGQVGGSGSNPEVNSIAVDGSGNVYVEGYFIGTPDFDPGVGTANLTSSAAGANYSVFFAKYDVNGNYLWANCVNPPLGNGSVFGNSMTIDAAGNMYITGYFGVGTADFDPGPGIANLTTSGSRDVYIAKYDGNGNYLWVKGIGGTTLSDAIYAGYGHRSIALDDAGNIYITGYFYGTVDFDPGAGVATRTANTSFADIYFAKYDNNGNYTWAASVFASSDNDYGYGIAVDGTGNVYITGYFSSAPADFDPGAGVANLSPAGAEDIFIAKYDAGGNYLWAKRVGGTFSDKAFSIAIDDSSNTYISGYFNGTVDFDPDAGTANLVSAGWEDIYFAKYNAGGNYVWAAKVGGSSNDYGQSIVVDATPEINIYIAGYFSSAPSDFDPDTGTANLNTIGSWDVYFAKYCQTTCCSVSALTATATTVNANCGLCNGTATTNVSGGSGNYDYQWSTAPAQTNTSATGLCAGTYSVTVTDSTGCSCSTVITVTVVQSGGGDTSITSNVSICFGDSIFLSGSWQSAGGTYYDSLSTVYGCDSIIETTLTVDSIFFITAATTICADDSIQLPGGNWINTGGVYYDTLITIAGCDSIIETTLIVNPTATTTATAAICSGDSIFLLGAWQTSAGTYYDTLTAGSGCDSIIETTLSVLPVSSIQYPASICNGDSIFLQGSWQTTSGTYYDTLTAGTGCDSIIEITLTVDSFFLTAASATICTGDSIQLPGGAWVNAAGTYYDTLTAGAGCDSIIETTLTVDSAFFTTASVTICTGDSIQLPGGNWINTGGVYYDTLTAVAGCDSIIQTTLTVNPTATATATAAICTGDSIFLSGSWQSAGGAYYDTLVSINGCDSVIETTLSVDSIIFNPVSVSICPGDSIQLPDENWVSTGGIYYDTLIAVAGCDSVIETTLTVNPVSSIQYPVSICSGDSIFLQGAYQTTAGTYYDTLSAVNGCDSIITTTVSVNPLPVVDAGPDVTIFSGTDTTLMATGSNGNYSWKPTGSLSCTVCQSPVVSPETTET